MDAINLNFSCSDVKGLQTSKKCLKLVKYFKDKIFPNGISFLQETHSKNESKIKTKDKFDSNLYFFLITRCEKGFMWRKWSNLDFRDNDWWPRVYFHSLIKCKYREWTNSNI